MRNALYINGQWVQPARGGQLDVINPANKQVFAKVPDATAEDVDKAVSSAREAFDNGPWGRTTGADRAAVMRRIATLIEARVDDLAKLETLDNGKVLAEAKDDITETAKTFLYYADMAERLDSRVEPLDVGDTDYRVDIQYVPVGVAALVVPWNYPLLMAAWKICPALAAGCTIVLKPSEFTPMTALELCDIAHDAQLPPGVMNIVIGTGIHAGAPLVRHPGVDKVAFTGSVRTGVDVAQAAAADVRNCSLELGGKSPCIVFDDVDIDQVLDWILFGIFANQGQVCSATSRLLVHDKIADRFIARLVEVTEAIKVGDGLDPSSLIGPLVNEIQYTKVNKFIQDAIRLKSGQLLCGGKAPKGLENVGYFLEPTVFDKVDTQSAIWKEEIFGPVLSIVRFSDEKEAIRIANDTEFGLAAAVMSKDTDRCERVSKQLQAGCVWVNCSQPAFYQAPWGGMKKSGTGRELGKWGLDNYLEVKQVTRYTSSDALGWMPKSKM